MQKFEILLENPRSPLISALKHLAQYKGDKGVTNFTKLYSDIEGIIHNPLDLPKLTKENHHLEAITQELFKNQETLRKMQAYILKQQTDMSYKYNPHEAAKKVQERKEEEIAFKLEERAKQMYAEYQATFKDDPKKSRELTREEKLNLMRDALFVEYGQAFASAEATFPAFYCQDLIIFGLEKGSPEAIRLGERMLSEIGGTLSRDLQLAVKNYMLENTEKYQEAARSTGPIDNATLYRKVKGRFGREETPVMINRNDPYWEELFKQANKRELQWKLPSHLAWDHKPHGILDEVLDMKKLEETCKVLKQQYL